MPVLLDDKMHLVKLVFDFLKFQRLKNMAENTMKSYGWDLKIFYEFLTKDQINYADVELTAIADFVEFLGTTDIIRYNKLSIAATSNHVRSIDIWKLNTA